MNLFRLFKNICMLYIACMRDFPIFSNGFTQFIRTASNIDANYFKITSTMTKYILTLFQVIFFSFFPFHFFAENQRKYEAI